MEKELQKKIKTVNKKIEGCSKRLDLLKKELHFCMGENIVVCEENFAIDLNPDKKACGKTSMIKDVVYIQENYVYSDDAYCGEQWAVGEAMFDCPHCGYRNRLYNRIKIQELSSYFMKVIQVYNRFLNRKNEF